MAGRDRTVSVLIRSMPIPLREIAKRYQDARSLPSFSAAVIELIETHPRIAEQMERVYTEADSSLLKLGEASP